MVTLSPQGRAVAAIVLAFLLVTGSLDRIGTTAVAIVDDTASKDQFVAATIITMVVALGVLLLAVRAASSVKEQPWALALAQGARVLAVIGLLITALNLTAALSNEYGGYHRFDMVQY